MKRYYYFVAYKSDRSIGNFEICMLVPVTTIHHVTQMADKIKEQMGFVEVVVTNFILLRTEQPVETVSA